MNKEQAKQLIALAEDCQRKARAARVATDQMHATSAAGTAVTAQMLSACVAAHSSVVDGLTKLSQSAAVSNEADLQGAVSFALTKANLAKAAISALGAGTTVAELAKIQPLDEDAVTAIEGVNSLVAGSQEIMEAIAKNWLAQLSPSERVRQIGVGAIGVVVLIAVIGVFSALANGTLIAKLAQNDIARGLITFLLSVATVVLAIILTLSALLMGNATEDAEKRFSRGKEVLTVFIGVFGTILGFYYGSAKNEAGQGLALSPIAVARSGTNSVSIAAEVSGGQPPYKFSIAFKGSASAKESVKDKETKEGKINYSSTNLTAPLGFTLTVTDRTTNSMMREYQEQ